jgi:hypothetical protein
MRDASTPPITERISRMAALTELTVVGDAGRVRIKLEDRA